MKLLITAIVFLIFPALGSGGGRVDTAQAQRFTGNNMFPRWSHDGKKIVFTSDRDGDRRFIPWTPTAQTCAADPGVGPGCAPVLLARWPQDPLPTPRGNGKDTNIYVMNSDGSNVVQLTNLKGFAGVPEYSPDERLIVFQWRV
jgi:hypothetical protein